MIKDTFQEYCFEESKVLDKETPALKKYLEGTWYSPSSASDSIVFNY